ncbi:MAG: helix-turn-helix domain-containing protein [Micrococcales bacterium]|nr:helix-turn-helix domain-containing protein [Micrococcales bacterium]
MPNPEARLLELLANDASPAELSAVGADPTARDHALRIRSAAERRKRREAELTALVETARELTSTTDTDSVLTAIVRRARALIGSDLAYLSFVDSEQGHTSMRAADGVVSATLMNVRWEPGEGMGGLVAESRKPYWTADYINDPRFRHARSIDGAVDDEGIVAICATPLTVGEDLVGVLFAADRSPRPYSHDEVALLGSFAALAAVSLVQAQQRTDTARALSALSEAHQTVRRQADGVERAAAAHDRFVAVILGGGGVDDITGALVSLLGGWAVLVDDEGRARSTSGPAPQQDSAEMTAALTLAHDISRLTQVGEGTWAVPVTGGQQFLGHLVIGSHAELDSSDQRTIERAAVVTALVLLFERSQAETRQQLRTDLVSDLVRQRGDEESRAEAVRQHGFDPSAPYCVLVARSDATTPRRSLVLSVAAALGDASLVGEANGDIVSLVHSDDPAAAARELAGRLSRRARVTVGGSGPVTGVSQVANAHDEATRTVAALLALGHEGSGGAADDLGFAGLIVGSAPDVRAYVQAVLGPVLAYDAQRGTDLMETLDSYFAAGSSPRHTATALHVHVNTVAQRLDRVSTLIGPDWQQPQRALEVQLALRLRHLTAASGR